VGFGAERPIVAPSQSKKKKKKKKRGNASFNI
jgi:hypothetical protein